MPQTRNDLLNRLSCKPNINHIRAKIQVARPCQGAIGSDDNLLEDAGSQPSLEHPDASVVRKVNDAADPVVEHDMKTIAAEGFYFSDFHFATMSPRTYLHGSPASSSTESHPRGHCRDARRAAKIGASRRAHQGIRGFGAHAALVQIYQRRSQVKVSSGRWNIQQASISVQRALLARFPKRIDSRRQRRGEFRAKHLTLSARRSTALSSLRVTHHSRLRGPVTLRQPEDSERRYPRRSRPNGSRYQDQSTANLSVAFPRHREDAETTPAEH